MSMQRRSLSNRPIRTGFTLIELLVVISIIALLVGILLPSLSKARMAAKTIACASQLKGLGNGVAVYAADQDEWIPGLNTSGVRLRALGLRMSGEPDLLRDSSVPVQAFDWISPILSEEIDLPNNRALRMKAGTERFKCPSQVNIESVLYGVNNSPDKDDFLAEDTWTALSYLMPVWFQYWGQAEKGKVLAPMYQMPVRKVYAISGPEDWEVRVNSYVSRVGRVGPPALKIMASDATRYLTDTQILDHDISPRAATFGSYTTSGGWWAGSTAFGVRNGTLNWDNQQVQRGSPGDGLNLRLTYRHNTIRERSNGSCQVNKGKINAMFWDGHVEAMTDSQSRKIDHWYPRGATVEHEDEGMTEVPMNYVIR